MKEGRRMRERERGERERVRETTRVKKERERVNWTINNMNRRTQIFEHNG